MTKTEKAIKICHKVIELVGQSGRFEVAANVEGKPFRADLENDLTVLYTTPFARLPGLDGYLLDIWYKHRKVFSAGWHSEVTELEMICFKRGNWEDVLLGAT